MNNVKATIYRRTSRLHQAIAYLVAFILLVMALAQLFSFEQSRETLATLLPASMAVAVLPIFSIIVTLEVVALPYFLLFPLSRLARWCALIAAIVVPLLWIVVMIVGKDHHGAAVPLLGSVVHIPLGFGSLLFTVVLLALIVAVAVRDRK